MSNNDIEKRTVDPEVEQDHAIGQIFSGETAHGLELIPHPTIDPYDPLNLPRWRKYVLLGIVMWMYFLFTYITTTTVPTFAMLQEQFDVTYSQINWTLAIPALGLSVGPLFWGSLGETYGRRMVFLLGTLVAIGATIGSAATNSYGGYMAARFFMGFGVSPASNVGLAILQDIFFEHERGQKVGLWVLAIDMGCFIGPLIGGFISVHGSAWVAWLVAIFFGLALALEFIFMRETLYPRQEIVRQLNTGISPDQITLKRTMQLPLLTYGPIPGIAPVKPWDTLWRFLRLIPYVQMSVPVFLFCFFCYWWMISVITMIPAIFVDDSASVQGLMFLGLAIGTLVAEILCSGTLSDYIMNKRVKRGLPRTPEPRLWLMYPGVILTTIGLALFGAMAEGNWHWMWAQFSSFLVGWGIQMGNASISAYAVDCFPDHFMDVITFYSVLLNLSAFCDPWFAADWVDTNGYGWSFGIQAMLTFFPCMIGFSLIHYFGPTIRAKIGTPKWEGNGGTLEEK
ncbi:hypothetical protein CANCADRAFT_81362 [Tortispora caseinolytica NRRL Y-17796]|uniref:Major facilitator superfamily (MFS) profile domain-containing protein n=1 Tax=Tortispora caseinolytica NRRL Y-17796 TaxID=767744 RepID=A0A1E4TJX4_9ASCO|nr:hypothetical protein CANCADRAFT_81362 [Tortispora caseinolytica NRRL Y-17796]